MSHVVGRVVRADAGETAPGGPPSASPALAPRPAPAPNPTPTPAVAPVPALTRPGRYHLTLTVRGQVVLHGWWDDADVAEAKCAGLVREHQDHGGVEVRLTELDDDEREWPLSEWVSPGSG